MVKDRAERPVKKKQVGSALADTVTLVIRDASQFGATERALWHYSNTGAILPRALGREKEGIAIVSVSASTSDSSHGTLAPLLKLAPSTIVQYLYRRYRFVFVMDASPTMFSVDIHTNRIPWYDICDGVKQIMKGLLTPIPEQTFGGARSQIRTEIFISVVAVPELSENEEDVKPTLLLHAVALKPSTFYSDGEQMDSVFSVLNKNLMEFERKVLGTYMQTSPEVVEPNSHAKAPNNKGKDILTLENLVDYGVGILKLLPNDAAPAMFVATNGLRPAYPQIPIPKINPSAPFPYPLQHPLPPIFGCPPPLVSGGFSAADPAYAGHVPLPVGAYGGGTCPLVRHDIQIHALLAGTCTGIHSPLGQITDQRSLDFICKATSGMRIHCVASSDSHIQLVSSSPYTPTLQPGCVYTSCGTNISKLQVSQPLAASNSDGTTISSLVPNDEQAMLLLRSAPHTLHPPWNKYHHKHSYSRQDLLQRFPLKSKEDTRRSSIVGSSGEVDAANRQDRIQQEMTKTSQSLVSLVRQLLLRFACVVNNPKVFKTPSTLFHSTSREAGTSPTSPVHKNLVLNAPLPNGGATDVSEDNVDVITQELRDLLTCPKFTPQTEHSFQWGGSYFVGSLYHPQTNSPLPAYIPAREPMPRKTFQPLSQMSREEGAISPFPSVRSSTRPMDPVRVHQGSAAWNSSSFSYATPQTHPQPGMQAHSHALSQHQQTFPTVTSILHPNAPSVPIQQRTFGPFGSMYANMSVQPSLQGSTVHFQDRPSDLPDVPAPLHVPYKPQHTSPPTLTSPTSPPAASRPRKRSPPPLPLLADAYPQTTPASASASAPTSVSPPLPSLLRSPANLLTHPSHLMHSPVYGRYTLSVSVSVLPPALLLEGRLREGFLLLPNRHNANKPSSGDIWTAILPYHLDVHILYSIRTRKVPISPVLASAADSVAEKLAHDSAVPMLPGARFAQPRGGSDRRYPRTHDSPMLASASAPLPASGMSPALALPAAATGPTASPALTATPTLPADLEAQISGSTPRLTPGIHPLSATSAHPQLSLRLAGSANGMLMGSTAMPPPTFVSLGSSAAAGAMHPPFLGSLPGTNGTLSPLGASLSHLLRKEYDRLSAVSSLSGLGVSAGIGMRRQASAASLVYGDEAGTGDAREGQRTADTVDGLSAAKSSAMAAVGHASDPRMGQTKSLGGVHGGPSKSGSSDQRHSRRGSEKRSGSRSAFRKKGAEYSLVVSDIRVQVVAPAIFLRVLLQTQQEQAQAQLKELSAPNTLQNVTQNDPSNAGITATAVCETAYPGDTRPIQPQYGAITRSWTRSASLRQSTSSSVLATPKRLPSHSAHQTQLPTTPTNRDRSMLASQPSTTTLYAASAVNTLPPPPLHHPQAQLKFRVKQLLQHVDALLMWDKFRTHLALYDPPTEIAVVEIPQAHPSQDFSIAQMTAGTASNSLNGDVPHVVGTTGHATPTASTNSTQKAPKLPIEVDGTIGTVSAAESTTGQSQSLPGQTSTATTVIPRHPFDDAPTHEQIETQQEPTLKIPASSTSVPITVRKIRKWKATKLQLQLFSIIGALTLDSWHFIGDVSRSEIVLYSPGDLATLRRMNGEPRTPSKPDAAVPTDIDARLSTSSATEKKPSDSSATLSPENEDRDGDVRGDDNAYSIPRLCVYQKLLQCLEHWVDGEVPLPNRFFQYKADANVPKTQGSVDSHTSPHTADNVKGSSSESCDHPYRDTTSCPTSASATSPPTSIPTSRVFFKFLMTPPASTTPTSTESAAPTPSDSALSSVSRDHQKSAGGSVSENKAPSSTTKSSTTDIFTAGTTTTTSMHSLSELLAKPLASTPVMILRVDYIGPKTCTCDLDQSSSSSSPSCASSSTSPPHHQQRAQQTNFYPCPIGLASITTLAIISSPPLRHLAFRSLTRALLDANCVPLPHPISTYFPILFHSTPLNSSLAYDEFVQCSKICATSPSPKLVQQHLMQQDQWHGFVPNPLGLPAQVLLQWLLLARNVRIPGLPDIQSYAPFEDFDPDKALQTMQVVHKDSLQTAPPAMYDTVLSRNEIGNGKTLTVQNPRGPYVWRLLTAFEQDKHYYAILYSTQASQLFLFEVKSERCITTPAFGALSPSPSPSLHSSSSPNTTTSSSSSDQRTASPAFTPRGPISIRQGQHQAQPPNQAQGQGGGVSEENRHSPASTSLVRSPSYTAATGTVAATTTALSVIAGQRSGTSPSPPVASSPLWTTSSPPLSATASPSPPYGATSPTLHFLDAVASPPRPYFLTPHASDTVNEGTNVATTSNNRNNTTTNDKTNASTSLGASMNSASQTTSPQSNTAIRFSPTQVSPSIGSKYTHASESSPSIEGSSFTPAETSVLVYRVRTVLIPSLFDASMVETSPGSSIPQCKKVDTWYVQEWVERMRMCLADEQLCRISLRSCTTSESSPQLSA